MENNENIKEAKEKLEEISNDEIMQRLADWREAAEHDEASVRNMAFNEGMINGAKQRDFEIAKKMREKGMDINTIAELTGLTIKEIENIK